MNMIDSESTRVLNQLENCEVDTSKALQFTKVQVKPQRSNSQPHKLIDHRHSTIQEDEHEDGIDKSDMEPDYGDIASIDSDTTNSVNHPFDHNDSTFHYNLKSALETLKPSNIGLACLPIQKSVFTKRKGANFTMLLVGQSGLGKTSFINTLFDSLLIKGRGDDNFTVENKDDTMVEKTTSIIKRNLVLEEAGFELRLSCLDTPGFGDYVNNKYCWYPIVKYVDEQYRSSIYQENQPYRSDLSAGQIHACLYFIAPSGNPNSPLTQLDIECMTNLSARVNLIPVIAKADGFTSAELKRFKQAIRNVLKEKDISVCGLIDMQFRPNLVKEMPYTLINSVEYHTNSEGERVRGRQYKWGIAEVLNPAHCDFVKLRELLMGTNMVDLLSSTETHFENYRKDFLSYRLDKALKLAVQDDDLTELGIPKDSHVAHSVPSSRDLMNTTSDIGKKPSMLTVPNVDKLVDTRNAIDVLKLINKLSIHDTEKELVELNPEYLDLEMKMKKKFTDVVQNQNQKFKDWKRALYERQDSLNKDIENIHKRVIKLQEEVKEHPRYGTIVSAAPSDSAPNSGNTTVLPTNITSLHPDV